MAIKYDNFLTSLDSELLIMDCAPMEVGRRALEGGRPVFAGTATKELMTTRKQDLQHRFDLGTS